MARFLRNISHLKHSFHAPQICRGGVLGSYSQLCNFSSKGRRKSKSDGSDSGEENMSKKDVALKQALDQITSSFGKGSIMWLGRSESPRNVPVVSTGSFALDVALGIGGLPKGRVVEIYGPEASGKTTLALHVIAEAQKQGGYCVFVDAEHALDPALAETIGVNTENLLLSQPDCGEQALSLVDTLIRSGSVDVVVVDSVRSSCKILGLQYQMNHGNFMLLYKTLTIYFYQVRSKLSTFGFGGPTEVTCGGNALKFYASVRLNIRRTGFVKKGEETIGSQVLVKVVKNKHAPPFKNAEFELEFGKGICREGEIINLATKHKFVTKAGSFYTFNDQKIHGKEAFKNFLVQNESAREELAMKLREKLLEVENKKEQQGDISDGDASEEIISTDTTDEEAVTAIEA
ncbi:hypothetical protein Gogos_001375 [Gossypium gossypioides]|uniref:RecA family profile 2 domain-containing protein n=1 Tax=Gossypium gossypioides TaxID=34282 RepID=A0A7J9CVK1_GOSGO|nr:hypothetical protein [Gossypium gossypioides]